MAISNSEQFAITASRLCGWLYFFAWGASFYPQVILNIQRRTTKGLMPDFPLLNVVGFSCYTTSTAVFLYSSIVRQQYADRHPVSPEPTVRFNDLAFGIHSWVMCVVVYSQFWPRLWGWKKLPGVQRNANKVSLGLICGSLLAIAATSIMVIAKGNAEPNADGDDWAWIDVIYGISYVKLLLTVFKYVPQVIANFRRRSTIGWSITQQLFDFSGSVFSLLQLIIDSSLQGDWSGLVGNPMKLGLANISILFNITFMLQHYVLFGPVDEVVNNNPDEVIIDPSHGPRRETEPLLAAST